ncbi:MAG: hypothetical protein ACD_15C00137G0021 [uncultured bacterium]|nr:MAG: hypothetical protein ACD_15C00137G0021 [uncultured bacterium]
MDLKKRMKMKNKIAISLAIIVGIFSVGFSLFFRWEFLPRLFLAVAGIFIFWAAWYIGKLNKRVDKEL